jgi:hypothetical protein
MGGGVGTATIKTRPQNELQNGPKTKTGQTRWSSGLALRVSTSLFLPTRKRNLQLEKKGMLINGLGQFSSCKGPRKATMDILAVLEEKGRTWICGTVGQLANQTNRATLTEAAHFGVAKGVEARIGARWTTLEFAQLSCRERVTTFDSNPCR